MWTPLFKSCCGLAFSSAKYTMYTVKKVLIDISRPQPGCHLTKLSLAGQNSIILGQGRVWSVTPRLGTGIIVKIFLQCMPYSLEEE
jgi:hypothetical protein